MNTINKKEERLLKADLLEALRVVTSELGEFLDAADDQFGREQNSAYLQGAAMIRKAGE